MTGELLGDPIALAMAGASQAGRKLKSWTREREGDVDVRSLLRLERAAAHVVVGAPRRGRTATRVGLLSLGRGLFHERRHRVAQYVVASAHPGTEARRSLTTGNVWDRRLRWALLI